jgi:hypothetical protein
MQFRPYASFSIHYFDYDPSRHQLRVHYYDGRRKLCTDVTPTVVAMLRQSARPENLLLSHVGAACQED